MASTQRQLKISIPTSFDKLKLNFPEDPKGDVQIQFKDRMYKLQKAHLRLESNYFKTKLTPDRSILQIKQNFNEELFTNILQCFYGKQLNIKRKDAIQLYPIAQFLQIQSIISLLRTDIVANLCQYNFFQIFNLAYKYSDQAIFQKCLLQLQFHSFQQIKTEKQDLLQISTQLFKLIIKTHNRLPRQKRAFNVYEIKSLINQFCEKNNLPIANKSNLKFELIDKNHLNSNQYRDIFLNDNHSSSEKSCDYPCNQKKVPSRAFSLCQTKSQGMINFHPGAHSMNLTGLTQRRLYLEMDTTFQRKISTQLLTQKQMLFQQFKELNNQSSNQIRKSKDIKKQFEILKRKISEKSNQQSFVSDKITSIDSSLSTLQKNLSTQSQRLKQLKQSTSSLLQKYDQKQPLNSSIHSCNQSSIWDNNPKIQQFVVIKTQEKQTVTKTKSQNQNIQNMSMLSKSQSQIKQKNVQANSISTLKNQNSKQNNKDQSILRGKNKNEVNEKDKKIKQKQNKQKFITIFKQTRLEFDKETLIIKTQKQVESLASIICDHMGNYSQNKSYDRFVKYKLKHIYRAEKPKQQKNIDAACQKVSKQLKQELEYKQNIIFLCRVGNGKLIGAYTSSCLNLGQQIDIPDKNAYICNISQERKYKIKKQYQSEAIMVTNGYIVCFSYDFMISDFLFEDQNYCQWPSRYEKDTSKQKQNLKQNNKGKNNYNGKQKQKEKQAKKEQRGSTWLVGESQFVINELQVWEIQEIGSDMIL